MKEWNMIHKVKALFNDGQGLSQRKIAKKLGISRNTVHKYIYLNETEIENGLKSAKRRKNRLDPHKESIIQMVNNYPNLSAVKILRRLHEYEPNLKISARSMRRYLDRLKEDGLINKPFRKYESVVDMLPAAQCQVDGGELRDVTIGGQKTTVYLMVFVLSCSRLMHVCASLKPINTQIFINMHDAAFKAFGGMTEELVYDQTKLVVIHEKHRELELNQRFAQYATTAGFKIRACEGYDPESKGKVEAGVKYVKTDGLYGEEFRDFAELEQHLADWLKNVANQRLHGTTGRRPAEYFMAKEHAFLNPYLKPDMPETQVRRDTRKVDKTGLISWKGNRYSVPMSHQRGVVYVSEDVENGEISLFDPGGELLSCWCLSFEKGGIFKNKAHYYDLNVQISSLETDIYGFFGDKTGQILCERLKKANPDIYKAQLRGLKGKMKDFGILNPQIIKYLGSKNSFGLKHLIEIIEAWQANPKRMEKMAIRDESEIKTSDKPSSLLACYGKLVANVIH